MTAVIRNNAGEDRFIPLAGRHVADGETFELDDDEFDRYEFGPDFKVVEEPKRSPKKRAAAKKTATPRKRAAAKKKTETPPATPSGGDGESTPATAGATDETKES